MSASGLLRHGALDELRVLSLEADARNREDWTRMAEGGQAYPPPSADMAGVSIRARTREDARLLLAAAPHIGDLVRVIDYLEAENRHLKHAIAGEVRALQEALDADRGGKPR